MTTLFILSESGRFLLICLTIIVGCATILGVIFYRGSKLEDPPDREPTERHVYSKKDKP